METRIAASLPDVTAVSSAPRPTATTASIPFADVLAGTVVRGAEGAVNALPGGPIMTVALRGGISAATSHTASVSNGVSGFSGGVSGGASSGIGAVGGVGSSGSSSSGLTTPVSSNPQGPTSGSSSSSSTLGQAMTGAVNDMTGAATSTDGSGIDSSLAQSQQQNLYYLQIQEQVNQENRSFSTLSNVLKAEHDTMKTAIGNIH